MTPLARALNALERLNARAASNGPRASGGVIRPDRQRDPSAEPFLAWAERQRDPSEPRVDIKIDPEKVSGMAEHIRQSLMHIDREYGVTKTGGKVPSSPLDAMEGDAGTHGGYDATERAWRGAGVPGPYPMTVGPSVSGEVFELLLKSRDSLTAKLAERNDTIAELAADLLAKDDSLDKARAEVTQLAVELVAKDDTVERLSADLASRTGDLDDAEAQVDGLWTQLEAVQTAFERRAR